MQLTRGRLLIATLLLSAAADRAEAQLTIQGNYWRDRNTRVLQPTVDISKELPSGTTVGVHYLLDAITSASAAAGAFRDEPFTEMRNEVGARLGQRVGAVTLSAAYSYSAESDYWAHTASTGLVVDLFKRNTTLGVNLTYGADTVAARVASAVYAHVGGLQKVFVGATLNQVLSRTLLLNLSYQIGILGFGDELGSVTGEPNAETGQQSNPYRAVLLGATPEREHNPYQRIRQSIALAVHWALQTRVRAMPYLGLRPSYRAYWDDWGIVSHTPELRLFVPVGPVELRLTGRYYTQSSASFWRDDGLRPSYAAGLDGNMGGVRCRTCTLGASRSSEARFYTGDPKLASMTSVFLELRVLLRLDFLRRFRRLPLSRWLSEGLVELSYGPYLNAGYAHTAFGNAHVAGLSFTFPL